METKEVVATGEGMDPQVCLQSNTLGTHFIAKRFFSTFVVVTRLTADCSQVLLAALQKWANASKKSLKLVGATNGGGAAAPAPAPAAAAFSFESLVGKPGAEVCVTVPKRNFLPRRPAATTWGGPLRVWFLVDSQHATRCRLFHFALVLGQRIDSEGTSKAHCSSGRSWLHDDDGLPRGPCARDGR